MEQEQEREFSFYEMFVYCFRKWFIILIAAVIGIGCALTYVVVAATQKDAVAYEATIWVADISKFFPDNLADKDIQAMYLSRASRALDVMTTDTVKNTVYSGVKAALEGDKKEGDVSSEKEFFKSLTVARGTYFISVKYAKGTSSVEDETLCKLVVSTYIAEAMKAAAADSPKFGEEGILIPSEPYRNYNIESDAKKTQSAITSMIVGALGGAVIGFLITVMIYFCDRKVKAFSAIADVCNYKLLGCGKMDDLASSYPMLDKEMTEGGKKVTLLARTVFSCDGYADKFSEYSVLSGRKTLLIEACKNGENASAEVFSGELSKNIFSENSVDKLIYCDSDVKKILPNLEKIKGLCGAYDRVIVDATFNNSGSMACFGVIADSYVVIFDQTQTTKKEIFAITEEIDALDKAEGAIIFNPGKGFVGHSI